MYADCIFLLEDTPYRGSPEIQNKKGGKRAERRSKTQKDTNKATFEPEKLESEFDFQVCSCIIAHFKLLFCILYCTIARTLVCPVSFTRL